MKKIQIRHEISFVKNEIEKTSLVYNDIFSAISKRLTSKALKNNHKSISLLLKKFYLSTKKAGVNKIDFLDISWYGNTNNLAVNRYGIMSTSTAISTSNLTQKSFSPDIENNLLKFPNTLFLYAIENNNNFSKTLELYFIMGITNSKGEYIGKLVVLLDKESWINSLKKRLDNTDNVMIVIGNKQEKEILFSSNKQLESSTIDTDAYTDTDLKFTGRKTNDQIIDQVGDQIGTKVKENTEVEENIESQINVLHKGYVFLGHTKFSPSSYRILYGYNRELFLQELIKSIMPSLIALWVSALCCLGSFFFFNKRLRVNIKEEFINNIEALTEENNRLAAEKANIIAEFTQQLDLYKTTAKYDEDLLIAFRMSNQAKERISFNINNNIANSLSEIREFIKTLILVQEGTVNIAMSYDKQIAILVDVNNKLAYISEFCAAYQEEDVNVTDAILEVLDIYAIDIFLNNLNINPEISGKISSIKFNKLLFQQIIAGLLYLSLEYSRQGGMIRVEAIRKIIKNKDSIVITIKDNGYHVSAECENKLQTEKSTITSPLQLNFYTIKNIVETHLGILGISYTKQGKVISLTLPCNPASPKAQIAIEGGNVVFLKKR